MSEFYTVKDVALMSGLTERTVRNYIQSGILKGTKCEGIWKFSVVEVNAFFEHPSVLPSIQTKRNGVVFDCITNRSKCTNQMCTIIDLPSEDGKKVSQRLRDYYNSHRHNDDLMFYFEDFEGYPRVIVKGQIDDVIALINTCCSSPKIMEENHEV